MREAHPVSRRQVLRFRQFSSHLVDRLRKGSFAEAAYAGLQDSSPRSALLSLHARVQSVPPSAWEDNRLAQIWGMRGAVYIVPKEDLAIFTLGRLPRDPISLALVKEAAERADQISPRKPTALSLQDLFDLRAASMTGKFRIRWDGSHISWWTVEPPIANPEEMRRELIRRFLHSLGPTTPRGFAWWAGVAPADARTTFRSVGRELSEVNVEGKQEWILRKDLRALEHASLHSSVRLLPPGDAYLGVHDRALLVPESRFRTELWPKSVWPGALFESGELTGTWRRQRGRFTIRPWRRLSRRTVKDVEEEVRLMPLEPDRAVVWREPMTRKRQ